MSRDSSASDCSSWPFSRATAAWLARVSSRRRSSSSKLVPSVRRLATVIEPISPDSVISGLTIAWRIGGPVRVRSAATALKNPCRSAATRAWIGSSAASLTGTIAVGTSSWIDVVRSDSPPSPRA